MNTILKKLVGKECAFYTSIEDMPTIEGRVTDVDEEWIEILCAGGVNATRKLRIIAAKCILRIDIK